MLLFSVYFRAKHIDIRVAIGHGSYKIQIWSINLLRWHNPLVNYLYHFHKFSLISRDNHVLLSDRSYIVRTVYNRREQVDNFPRYREDEVCL